MYVHQYRIRVVPDASYFRGGEGGKEEESDRSIDRSELSEVRRTGSVIDAALLCRARCKERERERDMRLMYVRIYASLPLYASTFQHRRRENGNLSRESNIFQVSIFSALRVRDNDI